MSVSEELARLAALRDQGVLSAEEFEDQKAKVLKGGSAPAALPVTEKKKPSPVVGCLSIVGLIVVVLIVIGALSGKSGTGSGSSETAQQDNTPGMPVTAQELFSAYDANEAAAQERYGDKKLLVSGTISGVDLDISDNPVVLLATANQFMPVHAQLADQSKKQAASLSKGSPITLTCTKVSEVIGTPMLDNCVI